MLPAALIHTPVFTVGTHCPPSCTSYWQGSQRVHCHPYSATHHLQQWPNMFRPIWGRIDSAGLAYAISQFPCWTWFACMDQLNITGTRPHWFMVGLGARSKMPPCLKETSSSQNAPVGCNRACAGTNASCLGFIKNGLLMQNKAYKTLL